MFKKSFFATLVALMLVCSLFVCQVSAASRYSSWFDLDRINAIDVEEDLTEEATRKEVALLIAELCDELGLLPQERHMDFEDDDDFNSSQNYKLITRLSSIGIVCGYPDGEFKPEKEITRAETVAIILRTIDYFELEKEYKYRKTNQMYYFSDIENHWAAYYCNDAYLLGLVEGRGHGKFYPDEEITGEEIVTILINLMGESNNPLIAAVDKVYGLKFANDYKDVYKGNRYNDRYSSRYDNDYYYDDDDYDERTERPVVNTGNSNSSSNSNSSNNSSNGTSYRPERPIVDLSGTDNTTTYTTNSGGKPTRPVVDLTTDDESTTVERPSVDVSDSTTASTGRPTRPTV